MIAAAREYLQHGLSPIPVGPDKRPLVRWEVYQDEPPHVDQVDEWWTRWPAANLGIVTGRVSGVVVFDADGPEGLDSLKALSPPATTWLSRTGRGWHQWFQHPGVPIGNRAGIRPHLDVRGDGGYVVAPPSLHASGRRYEWLTPPDRASLAPLPDHLLRLLTAPAPPPPAATGAESIPEGQRNDALYRMTRSLIRRGLSPGAVHVAVAEESRAKCRPPLSDQEVRDLVEHALLQPNRADFDTGALEAPGAVPVMTPPAWPLYDAADAWDFAPVEFTLDELLPVLGVVWWGGPPKRFKSLLLLYCCLAIACQREQIAGHFPIRRRPKILYVAREDGGSRLQSRRDDIMGAWATTPAPGAIRFLIRPRFDLFNVVHVAWLRDKCLAEGITLLVLDTWTALSPGADPLAPKDQAALAAVVVQLAEAIKGAVVVVDHSRKNRVDDRPLSSADIFGPIQKWAAAEHIVMMDLTSDRRRLELFIESKDGDTRRCFLTVTRRGAGGEKFTYAGTIEEIADAQRQRGNENRDAVHRALVDAGTPQRPADVHAALKARGVSLALDTVASHLRTLAEAGRVSVEGKGRATRYVGIPDAPSAEIHS